MTRLLIALCLLSACDLPRLDTPAAAQLSRAAGRPAEFPDLVPIDDILAAAPVDSAELANAGRDLAAAAARQRATAPGPALTPQDSARLKGRAADLRARADTIRSAPPDPASAPDLLDRAARLRERAAQY